MSTYANNQFQIASMRCKLPMGCLTNNICSMRMTGRVHSLFPIFRLPISMQYPSSQQTKSPQFLTFSYNGCYAFQKLDTVLIVSCHIGMFSPVVVGFKIEQIGKTECLTNGTAPLSRRAAMSRISRLSQRLRITVKYGRPFTAKPFVSSLLTPMSTCITTSQQQRFYSSQFSVILCVCTCSPAVCRKWDMFMAATRVCLSQHSRTGSLVGTKS